MLQASKDFFYIPEVSLHFKVLNKPSVNFFVVFPGLNHLT